MYDVKCYDLAQAFLEDEEPPAFRSEERINRLAQVIQDAIEDEIDAWRSVPTADPKVP